MVSGGSDTSFLTVPVDDSLPKRNYFCAAIVAIIQEFLANGDSPFGISILLDAVSFPVVDVRWFQTFIPKSLVLSF